VNDDAPIRVLIVEDHALFSQVLRLYLEREPELIVVDAVATAEAAIGHPHLQDVDVVLTDIGLGLESGIIAIPRLHALNPNLRIVVMSGSGRDETAKDAFAAGASAYLEKGPLDDSLVATLLEVGRAPRQQSAR
jgi:DNA-binding NarL/FixJ family response regulator